MLTGIVVDNFKGFGNRQEIPLRPITLVFGGNSAGKSSIIQALLLLRQSLVSAEFMPSPLRTAELVVRGAFVDLGSFDALVHAHDRSRTLTLGLAFEPSRFLHPEDARLPPGESVTVEWRYARQEYDTEIHHVSSAVGFRGETIEIPVGRDQPVDLRSQRHGRFSSLSVEDTAKLFRWAANRADIEPSLIEGALLPPPTNGRAVLRTMAGIPIDALGLLSEGVLGRSADAEVDDEDLNETAQDTDSPERARRNALLGQWLRGGPGGYRGDLSAVSYLGPLRAAPERLHVLTGERVRDTGTTGERVVDLLARSTRLLGEVNAWLKKLEIPYSADIRAVTDQAVAGAIGEVHCLLLRDERTGVEVSPTDVGFGIGQVLPVVVQSILPRPGAVGGTLCIEQPEIHLHPALQARLAEMFAEIVRTGHGCSQFILETHSEHLILRLQRLIRAGRLSASDVSVLHVGHDAEDRSIVRQIALSEEGEFLDEWPSGFFDERFDEVFGA